MRALIIALLVAGSLLPVFAGGVQSPTDDYRARWAAISSGDAAAYCRLALWCRQHGMPEKAKSCFEVALAADPDNLAARRGLDYEKVADRWLCGPALKKARGFVHLEGRWVLREEAIAHEARRRETLLADEKRREALVRATHLVKSLGSRNVISREAAGRALRALDVRTTFRPLVAAINSSGPVAMRRGAVEVLAGYESKATLRPLIRASLTDLDSTVRDSAMGAVRGMDVTGKLAPYVTALGSMHGRIRHNAVDAIGKLGDVRGIQVLIRHWEQWGGGAPRSHIFTGKQTSFIQDFDVEVAATAFIADPHIGALQDGSVLETRVMGTDRRFTTVERQFIRRSLEALSGVDKGDDVKAWVSWAAANGRHTRADVTR